MIIVIIVLIGIAISLSLLLIVDKKSKEEKANECIEEYFDEATSTELISEVLQTELMVKHKQEFDLKGKTLNGLYRVEGVLGEGGMGRVYLCRNIKLGNLWAIKFIPNHNLHKTRLRFAEEDILKKLHHIHLPQIVDIFRDDKGTYIVESYIEGKSLDKKHKEEGPFKEEVVLKWLRHLTDVLVYLHSMEPYPIIYGDMKPSNVMITRDGGAVLVDFSVSMELRDKNEEDYFTSPLGITVKFAAPEQLKGYLDIRSDIYSLGFMICHLLQGQEDLSKIGTKGLKGKVSKELLQLLDKCLKQDLHLRYQTAKELREDLNRLDKGKPSIISIFSKPTYQTPSDYKKLIAVMSPESTGKTTISAGLAWNYAEKGIKTILIDTDFINKDIYYYFNLDFANCLGNQGGGKIPVPQKINHYLSMYSEHRDVKVNLGPEIIKEIILRSKVDAQVVIVDLGRGLESPAYREILSLVDHKLLVVDQRVNVLNRLPLQLYSNRDWLKNTDLVINRYTDSGYLKGRNIKGYFKGIDVAEEGVFDLKINEIFYVREDYSAVLKALEEREPPVVYSTKIKEDIDALGQYYFPTNQ
ncbi:protein kinase domain-containing protein [Alkaliphilus hydrothermalis]|uniref:Serine/threonine protein kinase n=1 Tax=Alkaliphilus hydrothermalis TaxID=1482730 RepID=A0ABS2NKY2_9FIRM|nr:protein kinase [Alkaliphilus hydrothermalis]MBM7613594.1 serine/threonine protein kinase [Alkaliphilus hydrothermalis]